MQWIRGETLGHGSFGTVNLAKPRSKSSYMPQSMAVKSCGASHSASLMNEKLILDELGNCPEIIKCHGDGYSYENGEKLYNVFLEYAEGGSLSDKLKNSVENRLTENEVRQYTKSILTGLKYIHENGYVHCDIKLQNILLGQEGAIKIADFGLAKRAGAKKEGNLGCELRGTPLYMSPEMVTGGDQWSAADIWSLGCLVAEMLTGAPAWRCSDVTALLMRIGIGEELPEIPAKLSDEGKDFLGKCFTKDPRKRWTAEMLLHHPFITNYVTVKDAQEEVPSTSPRSAFDFPDWVSQQSSLTFSITSLSSPEYSPESNSWFSGKLNSHHGLCSNSPAEKLRGLVSNQQPDWSVSEDWVTIR